MGQTDNEQRDSQEFGQGRPPVRELILSAFRYPEMDETGKRRAQDLMVGRVEALKRNCPNPNEMIAFGWKRPSAAVTCEIFLNAYPEAKVVHLIRDGRDVMLSRLNSRMRRLHDPLNRLVVFGDAEVTAYRGRPLDRSTVEAYRNEIEMQHWVTVVSLIIRARKYAGRYLEVRYEDLCHSPEETTRTVFDFLDVPFRDEAREWVKANASTRSIGKWKGREEELADAIRVGEPLLKELGYA